jgi:hypothetical protein
LADRGEAHLRDVLFSIVESAGNERVLTAPVILAVTIRDNCFENRMVLSVGRRRLASVLAMRFCTSADARRPDN